MRQTAPVAPLDQDLIRQITVSTASRRRRSSGLLGFVSTVVLLAALGTMGAGAVYYTPRIFSGSEARALAETVSRMNAALIRNDAGMLRALFTPDPETTEDRLLTAGELRAELEALGFDWQAAEPVAMGFVCATVDAGKGPVKGAVGHLYLASGGQLHAIELSLVKRETGYAIDEIWNWFPVETSRANLRGIAAPYFDQFDREGDMPGVKVSRVKRLFRELRSR